jgi:hypothetical protein
VNISGNDNLLGFRIVEPFHFVDSEKVFTFVAR